MKITIEISEAEVKGITAYLKEVDGLKKVRKSDIVQFIGSYTDIINAPQEAVSHYINQFKNPQ